jgi:hypothetical protein
MATRLEKIAKIVDIGTGEPNTALEIRTILRDLLDPSLGEIKIKDVSNLYITTNFDGTGKGVGEESGYAICNGSNGTRNWAGKVPVAYGTGYLTMGASGGSTDAVIVEHSHNLPTAPSDVTGYTNVKTSSTAGGTPIATSTVGESGVDKNMQPYIVTLITMFIGY